MIRFGNILCYVILMFFITVAAWGQLPANGLVLYLNLDEGEGTIVNDQSATGTVGNISGDPSWVDGKFGGGLQFDGANNYVVIEHNTAFDFIEMTAAAWVNWSGLSAGFRFIICQWGSPGNEWIMRLDNAGHLAAIWFVDGAVVRNTDTGNFPQGQWEHVAVTFKDGEQKVYHNGEVVVSSNNTGTLAIGVNSIYIGSNGTKGDKFGGIMDEVALWNRVLSEDEIKSAMLGTASAVLPNDSLTTSWGKVKLSSK